MILRENYEPDISHFLNYIQQPCVFFDIGAHIGRYSILMAAKGHRVYSFEPIASNFQALNENLTLNHTNQNAQTFNLGISDKKQELTIHFEKHKTGEASIKKKSLDTHSETIQLDALDNLIHEKFKDLTILKMDVEGHELNAINGMRSFLSNNLPVIILELWSGNRESIGKILREMGYKNIHIFWFHDASHQPFIEHMNHYYNKNGLRYTYQ